VLIIEVDSAGRHTTIPRAVPWVRALTEKDTILADTPADFPLNLTNGPVVFVAEGTDSLRILVGSAPLGRTDHVRPFRINDPVGATGRVFTVSLAPSGFVIDKQ
jgi:hypothetical protein